MNEQKRIFDASKKNRIKLGRSIAGDLILSLSSAVALVMVLTIAFNYFHLARETRLQFEEKSNELATFLQSSLVLPLWNYDEDGINEICRMFLKNESVISLKVADSTAKVLFESTSNEAPEAVVHSGPVTFKGQNIGSVEVLFTDRVYRESNLQSLKTSLTMLIVVVTVLVFFTTIFLNIFLRAPLRELIKRINYLANGKYDPLASNSKQKEIVEIMAQFDHMTLKVKSREKSLADSNTRLFEESIEHLKTGNALRESESRFRDLVEMLPEAIFEADTEMRLTFVNKQAYAMFGYTEEDFNNGLNVLDMLSPKDCEKAFRNYIKKIDEVEAGAVEYSGKRKDGSFFPILLHSNAITSNGKVTGLRGVVVDITQRKTIEEKLAKDQKMSSIGSLAGGIAHDFNNILQPLIGFCELLKADTPAGSRKMRFIEGIFDSSMRAKDLVQQILTFSRQSKARRVPVRMQSILKEVLKLSRSTIPTIVEIHQDVQRDCGPVMADPTQLHQIAMNLIVNAYHAVEESGGTISVRLNEITFENNDVSYDTLRPGRYAKFLVSDTGCGIAPSILDKIFDPYFTTKEEGKGTGLGLSVVYGIVREYDGHINVSSRVGKGTTFEVLIPVAENATEENSPEEASEFKTGKEHILLVDDEAPIVTFERKLLKRLGYRVTSCYDSLEALEIFMASPHSVDLVITDMNMPKMNGDQLAKELIAIRSDIPVIMITGFSKKTSLNRSMPSGIKEVLLKPATASKISRVVRKVLDESKALKNNGFEKIPVGLP
jgi:PAS domain S-box-containing protein